MLSTYKAVLRDNQIEWSEEGPKDLAPGDAVPVYVTILDKAGEPVVEVQQGQQMAAILEQLAAINALDSLDDPAAWERSTRQDRNLPDRDA